MFTSYAGSFLNNSILAMCCCIKVLQMSLNDFSLSMQTIVVNCKDGAAFPTLKNLKVPSQVTNEALVSLSINEGLTPSDSVHVSLVLLAFPLLLFFLFSFRLCFFLLMCPAEKQIIRKNLRNGTW